jgi:hypothetical protein
MNDGVVLKRLRWFLLTLAAFMSLGTLVELALAQHWEDAIQILPFVLCGLSFLISVAMLLRPQRRTVLWLRWIMAITFVGSLFGVSEHIEHNIAFALEIRPNAVTNDVFLEALGGANPLLAPGILAFTALLALAATYYHPLLSKESVGA